MDLSVLLDRMDLDTWKLCTENLISTIPYQEISAFWESGKMLFTNYPLYSLWLEKLLWEKELTRGFRMKAELLKALESYAACIQSFYRKQYQDTMFEEGHQNLLPADCRMSLAVLAALEDWRLGNFSNTLRLFRSALQIYPKMTGVVREVLRILKNEIDHPAPAAGPEFEQLAIQMKSALKTMLDNSQYTEAMQVLSQLIPLLPNDIELIKLQQQLLEKTH